MVLPPELQQLAAKTREQPQQDILRTVYDVVSRRFVSSRHLSYLRFWYLFRKDLISIWNKGVSVIALNKMNLSDKRYLQPESLLKTSFA